jgi:hypothetical protein
MRIGNADLLVRDGEGGIQSISSLTQKRTTGVEPATFGLGSRRSTN